MEIVENTPKTKGIVNNPYGRKDIDEAERELQEAIEEEKRAANEENKNENEPKKAEEPEEEFKREVPPESVMDKRLRDKDRFITQLQKKVKDLETKVPSANEVPKTQEQMKAWMKKFPDVARIVTAIAQEQAQEIVKSYNLEDKFKEFREMQEEATIAKTEAKIAKAHPDYFEIKDDKDFHNWARDLPEELQSALYDRIDAPETVIRIIKMYKLENDLVADDGPKNAASAVSKRSNRSEAKASNKKYDFTMSQIDAMSEAEFEKNYEAISEARLSGRILNDI